MGGKILNKNILIIGVIFFFLFSLIIPITFGYNIKITNINELQSIGWNHQDGWPITFEVNFSHDNYIYDSVICDLECDNNLDVVVSYSLSDTESYIDAYDLNGSQKKDLGFPFMVPGKILGEASVGDLNNDGYMEIVVSVPVLADVIHSSIYVFEFDGEKYIESWHFMEDKKSGEIIHSPSLGDIDGDGDLEIITGTHQYNFRWAGIVYAFHHDGSKVSGWPVKSIYKSGSFYPTPSLGDIDNDGLLEVIVGTYYKYLYAWNGNGKLVSCRWPVDLSDDIRSHSPQLGDLDSDGDIEIIQIGAKNGDIFILDEKGIILQTIYPDIANFSRTPGLGDIDCDGDLEIFVNIGKYIYGWHHDGEKVNGVWPVFINNIANSARASIIIGDVNDDHQPDILFMHENSLDGCDIFAYHGDGTLIKGWPYTIDKANKLRSSPTLVDIDRDGDLEIAFTYNYLAYPPNPSSYTIDILDINSTYNAKTMHWPMYQNNPRHSGLYNKPCNNPPEKPIINGPIKGNVRDEYIFSAYANDPDGDNISYFFDWGDGTNSGWTDFILSGTMGNQTHKWWLRGIFEIKVKAKDCYASQSEWAILEVTMPRNKLLNCQNPMLLRLFEQFPLMQEILS